MNTVNVPKPSQKIPFLILLGVLLIGIPLTVIALQQTQIFQQFAWGTRQSAEAICEPEEGGAIINVSFTNTENSKSMDVVAKDLQSGKTVDLGTVKPKETKKGIIETESIELAKGSILFTMTWTDGSSGTDTRSAEYDAVEECEDTPPFCPANPEISEGVCKWDPVEGASGYEVEVTETGKGTVVKKELTAEDVSESSFPMVQGKGYECKVTPINVCSKGPSAKSPEKVCTVPPTPTPPVCPVPPLKQGICTWDGSEGATEYKIVVKNKDGEIVKEGKVPAPEKQFKFTADPEKTYICLVTPVGKCSEGPPAESPPTTCTVPSPTPTTPVPSQPVPSPTPTVAVPTPTPTVPPPTATVPPPPTPTVTVAIALPTPTPIVIVRIPTTPPQQPPPPVVIQRPPVVVQQPPVVVQQPPVVVQQPGAVVTLAPGQPSPMPTMKPTGTLSNSLVLVGASAILLLAGTLIFFIL